MAEGNWPPVRDNDHATMPPALERMVAESVTLRVRFGDGSGYDAEFGPCWADLAPPRPTVDLTDPGGWLAGELNPPEMTLTVRKRYGRGPATIPGPLGVIRVLGHPDMPASPGLAICPARYAIGGEVLTCDLADGHLLSPLDLSRVRQSAHAERPAMVCHHHPGEPGGDPLWWAPQPRGDRG